VDIIIIKKIVGMRSVGFGFRCVWKPNSNQSASINSNPILLTGLTRDPTHYHPKLNFFIGFIEFGSVREISSTPSFYNQYPAH
jgi:hypothetical protein